MEKHQEKLESLFRNIVSIQALLLHCCEKDSPKKRLKYMKKYSHKKRNDKPIIGLTFRVKGENGGPFVSHKRIMESCLKNKYEFIPIWIPKPKELIKPKKFLEIVQLLKYNNIDILHFAGLQLEGFFVLLIGKAAGIKTVCAIRGSSMDAINFHGWKRFAMKILENWTMYHSDACYGVSQFVSNWERVKKYARNYKGHIYNLPKSSSELFEQTYHKNTVRKEFGIGEKEIIVVSSARIVEDKGYEILMRVITSEDAWPGVRFLIVGEGSYLDEMKRKVDEQDLGQYVLFTGYREDIMQILDESDIFIICTLHETFCNSVVEASCEGLPVIASRVGGIPEIIKDGISGILIDPDSIDEIKNALKLLISDKELREGMGTAGKKIVEEKFSERRITDRIEEIYEDLLS